MYNIIFYILIFFLGAAFGSFVNVIVDRLYIKSFIKGRSHCHSCNKTLSWYEMIPVFSYLFLKGRCKKCKVKIGQKHLWTEIIFGILSVITYIFLLFPFFNTYSNSYNFLTGILFTIFYIFLFVVLGVIFLYDLKHKLVPTIFSFLLIVIGIAFEVFRAVNFSSFYSQNSKLFWLDLFSGFLTALPFMLIYLFSKRKAVGFGDILIFIGVGYILGFIFGVSVFLLSVWIGAISSLILIYFYPKKYNRKSSIPFTPFIIIATIIIIFLKLDILGISLFLK